MKKLLLLFFIFLTSATALWAETLTVNDGTDRNEYVPVRGYSADTKNQTSQFIQPATSLSAIVTGSKITRLKFFVESGGGWGTNATWKVYIKETSQTGLSSNFITPYNDVTASYTGKLTLPYNEMTVVLDNAYTYNGGNFVVTFVLQTTGSWSTTYFYGKQQSAYTARYNDGYGTGSGTRFLPKMDITYSAPGASCEAPATPVISSITTTGANVSWSAVGTNNYQYCVVKKLVIPDWATATTTSATSATLTGLEPNTDYQVFVRTKCSETSNSSAVIAEFKTLEGVVVPAPTNLTATAIVSDGCNISWTAAAGVSQYQYCVVAHEAAANWSAATLVSSTSATLSGLNPVTTYDVYVRSVGVDAYSTAISTSFTTLCGAVTSFPWSENFNGLTSGIPTCWDNSEGTNTNHTCDWIYNASGTGYDGGCIAFYPYYNSGKYNIIKTPMLQLANKPYSLSFQYYLDSYYATCELLIYVDGDVRQTIDIEDATSWTEKTIILSQYAGKTIQLGWKATSTKSTNGSRVRIDDVEVVELPECISPSNLNTTAITSSSAMISWDKGWNETSWNLKYKVATAGEWQTVNNITTKPYVLTGLSANTTYQVRVSPTCGEQWSETASFRTECGELEIGYTYSFEDDEKDASPSCWRVGCVSGGTTPTVYKDGYTKYAHDGEKSLRLFYASSNGKQAWVVMPVLPDDVDAKDLQVSAFVASSPSYADRFQVGVMTDPTDINTFVGYNFPTHQNAPETPCTKVKLDQYTGEGKYIAFRVVASVNAFLDEVKVSRIVKAPTNIVVTADQTSASVTFDQQDSKGKWQYQLNEADPVTITTQSFVLSELTAQTAYTLKLRHLDEENDEYSDWVDADFETASSWVLPSNVQVVTVGVHTASITFEQVDGKGAGWTYQYAQTSDFTGTTLTERTTPNTTVDLDELAEGRTYYFRVHQTGHLGHWTPAVSFTTDCTPLKYGEAYTFDDQENKRVPACWTNLHQLSLDYTSTVYEADSYNFAHSGTQALRINAYGDADYFQTIAMPAVADDQDVQDIILEFWVSGVVSGGTLENCVLEVGVMTDANDKNTFTAVESFTPDGTWRLHSTSFSGYAGTGKHIAFRTIGNKPGYNYKFFIDDLTLNKKELIRHHPSTTQYGTICLDKRTIDLEGATFWKIAYKTDALDYIIVEQVYELEAGRAYIFMPEQEDLYGVKVGEAVADPIASTANNGLQGTFVDIVKAPINALTDNYMLYNNQFVQCGANCSMPAERAYMVLSEVCYESGAAPQMAPRRALGSNAPQTPTALDNLNADMTGAEKKMIDGRLYIVREGKTYDVDGRLVKKGF